jgi:hypothetical protein
MLAGNDHTDLSTELCCDITYVNYKHIIAYKWAYTICQSGRTCFTVSNNANLLEFNQRNNAYHELACISYHFALDSSEDTNSLYFTVHFSKVLVWMVSIVNL